MKTFKFFMLSVVVIAAMTFVSCGKDEPSSTDSQSEQKQTEATVSAYYVTSAATLKYCNLTFTADGKEIKGTVKTLAESTMNENLVGNVQSLVGMSSMSIDEIRIVEFAPQKLLLGVHKVRAVLSRNTTAVDEAEINMAYGWQFSSTDGNITTQANVHLFVGVETAIGIDGEGNDNIIAVINEVGDESYTLKRK